MSSTVTSPPPQPLYQISPPPRIGAVTVEVLSYILLGLGGVLPVVFLLAVALILRCYRRHKQAQLNRWKAHLRQDRFGPGFRPGAAKSSHAKRSAGPHSDLENLSYSLQDSDLGLEPYFVGINHGADLIDDASAIDYIYPDEDNLKRSDTNSNVYFKDDGKKSRSEVDSAIAESERSSSLTDHQSNTSTSSTTEYHHHHTNLQGSIGGHKASADSGHGSLRPHEVDVAGGGRRVSGHPPGVIMGVNHLMDSTGRSTDRSNRNVLSGVMTSTHQPPKRTAPAPPPLAQLELTHPTSNHLKNKTDGEGKGGGGGREGGRGGGKYGGERRQENFGNDEEQVLRYFDDIHNNYLSYEVQHDNNNYSSNQDQKKLATESSASSSSSFRRNSNVYTTKL